METLIIIGLLMLGIILFLIEIFVIPGISIAGIGAIITFFYACYYAFTEISVTAGIISIVASALCCITMLIWVIKSKALDRVALKKSINSSVDNSNERSIMVGDAGITITRLALIGMADIKGKVVEVKSADGYLNEKTNIMVDRIEGGTILVKKQS